MASNTLSPELVKKFKKWLEEAEPYTYEEIIKIPADSHDYDLKRCKAYTAKKALKEAGLLDE